MFVTAREMYHLEEKVFASGIPAERLMNEAGRRVAEEIKMRFQHRSPGYAIGFIGKGNNGADALVVLRHLKEAGWGVGIRSASPPEEWTGLTAKKREELGDADWLSSTDQVNPVRPLVLVDGLLGIGTSGNLREPLAGLAREINHLSAERSAFVAAVDVPSGIHCDTGACGPETVRANLTCTLGSPKSGLVVDAAVNHVGTLALLPVQGLSDWDLGKDHLITPATLPVAKLARPFDFHKGQAGRVGLVAGSRGLAGAAALASMGALHGGAGLVTLFVREENYPLILPLVPIEVMVFPVKSYHEILEQNIDALAVGPGLGEAGPEVLSLVRRFPKNVVIDADALNLIARSSSISTLEPNHLVTPHPGEMARLLSDEDCQLSRAETAKRFIEKSRATLLFKGARTIVTARNEPLAYNTTGSPGMASGGQGDVLSGLLATLLARGFNPIEAAKTGAWLAGRAAELALKNESVESLSASTTARHLGRALNDLRERSCEKSYSFI
jgi:NAD(P)H-hydrate epimerase